MTDESTMDINTVLERAARYRNWGLWGPDDELGSMNYVTAEKVAAASKLVKRGRVFSLALPLDSEGPMTGGLGRINPVHVMLQDGGDIESGAQDHLPTLRYTDDAVYLVLQCSTQWDALAHIYHDGKMYNGYGTKEVNSLGAKEQHHQHQRPRGRPRRTSGSTAIQEQAVARPQRADLRRGPGGMRFRAGRRRR